MAMTKSQQEYALQRIDNIYKDKKSALEEKYGFKGVSLSKQEKFDLVKSGQVSLKSELAAPYNLYDAFDFSNFEREAGFFPEGKVKLDKLDGERKWLRDEIMLGDSQEALNMLKMFGGE